MMKNIVEVMRSGEVTRFHACPGIKPQNNAQHSWGLAVILMHLTDPSTKLLKYALLHDCAELKTGDIPFTFKKDNPKIKELADRAEVSWFVENACLMQLTHAEKKLAKLADCIEGYHYCARRIYAGELDAWAPLHEWANYLSEFNYRYESGRWDIIKIRAEKLIDEIRQTYLKGAR